MGWSAADTRAQIAAELAKADDALAAGEALLGLGLFDDAAARDLRRLAALRDAADYDRNFRFDRPGAEVEAEVARAFVARVRAWLASGGWVDAALA